MGNSVADREAPERAQAEAEAECERLLRELYALRKLADLLVSNADEPWRARHLRDSIDAILGGD